MDEAKARTSLRQVLHWLRQLFDQSGFGGLYADKFTVAIRQELISVDVLDTLRDAEDGVIRRELLDTTDYCGRVLAGFEDIDPEFRIWLLARRQSYQDRLVRALEAILDDGSATEPRRADAATALVQLDATHEEAVRHLMRARAEAGNVAAALKHYNALWEVLDEDHGMEPSAETQQLVVDIKSGAFETAEVVAPTAAEYPERSPLGPAPATVTALTTNAAPKRLVVAVEPFAGDAIGLDSQHLVAGFRHFLIALFVRFREWMVMDLDGPLDAGTAGEVGIVVRATVIGTKDRASLALTLKDVSSSIVVWSDQFELEVEEWMELQRRAVRSITSALNVHLSAGRLSRVATTPSVPARLFDSWLRGQSMINRLEPGDWRRASAMFEDVIREAPDFAPAYSSLVQLRNAEHIVHPGVFRDKERQDEALELAQTAARLDPVDSRAQLCLAWASAFDGQYERAELHFDLASELNDLDPWTLLSAAQGFAFLDDRQRATSLGEAGLSNCIEPGPLHWSYLAGIHFFTGDQRVALESATKAGDFLANNGMWRATALARLGRRDEARQETARCLADLRARWRGASPATDDEVTRWLLQLFPLRRESQVKTLRHAMRDAGFPVDD